LGLSFYLLKFHKLFIEDHDYKDTFNIAAIALPHLIDSRFW